MTGFPEPATVLKLAYTAHMFLAYGLHVYERYRYDSKRAVVLAGLSRVIVVLYTEMAQGRTAKIEESVTLAQKMQESLRADKSADWAALRRQVDEWLLSWEERGDG